MTRPSSRRSRAERAGRGTRCRSRAATSWSSCERLTADDEKQFENLWRRLGLSVDWSRTYQTVSPSSQAVAQQAFLRSLARGEAYQAEAPTLWDITFRTAVAQAELEDRERPGRTTALALRLRVAARPDLHRDHAARAAARVRGVGCAPRRRALPGLVWHDGCDSPVRGRGAGACAPPRLPGQGIRHRDDLHVRRHHGRHLVARAAAADARRARPRRPVPSRGPLRHSVGRRAGRLRRTGWYHRVRGARSGSWSCSPNPATWSASPSP